MWKNALKTHKNTLRNYNNGINKATISVILTWATVRVRLYYHTPRPRLVSFLQPSLQPTKVVSRHVEFDDRT